MLNYGMGAKLKHSDHVSSSRIKVFREVEAKNWCPPWQLQSKLIFSLQ